jgi:hypothetical protein
MEDTKDTNNTPGTQISAEQAGEVAGGDGSCTTTLSAGTSGIGIQTTGPTVGQVLISTYDGVVEATTHVIETVAHAAK